MRKRAVLTLVGFSSIWGFIFIFSILVSMGTTPVTASLNKETKFSYMALLPQGWGFFSKNPREPISGLYSANNDSLEVQWPNMSPKNLFGIYRKGRAQAVDMGLIMSKISKDKWTTCNNSSIDTCKEKVLNSISIKNNAKNPLICGEYYITRESIVPWNYAKYSKRSYEINKLVKVNIKCTKN